MSKDYDSTLTRMAGNIAAGFVTRADPARLGEDTRDAIASTSLDIADRIITRAKRMYQAEHAYVERSKA